VQYQPPNHAHEAPHVPPALSVSLTPLTLLTLVFAVGWFGATVSLLFAAVVGGWVVVRVRRRSPDVATVDPTGGPTRS
jgi:hypothetical protein